MKRFISSIKPYLSITLCYIIIALAIKTIDIISAPTFDGISTFEVFVRATSTTLIHSSFFALCLLPIFLIINLFSQKAAIWTTNILLSILILLDISLCIYTAHNGMLLGSEILVRPINEIALTIKGAVGITVPIISTIAIIGGFSVSMYFLQKHKLKIGFYAVPLVLILLSLPCVFLTEKLNSPNVIANNYIINRPYFLISDCCSYISGRQNSGYNEKIEFDTDMMEAFRIENIDFELIDSKYPLERIDNTPDILSEYFTENEQMPNIIVLVVESLGHEFMDPCFVPFIDSLAKNSLYWENCLSTTTRSFGALPAILGSVCGPHGFQFGTMPKHNSLISMLKNNGYQTNAFYSGYWTFDCIYEFLTDQQIDYMSPFYQVFERNKDEKLGTWWGYHDEIFFDKALEVIKEQTSQPKFNLFITLSSHDNLALGDEQKQDKWKQKVRDIASNCDDAAKKSCESNELRYAGITYTDDCIRQFISEYSKLPEYSNTIFIITGDHSSGLCADNQLSYNRVPLIIWSPMLTESAKFDALVTHNDICPSITKLLKNRYKLATPTTTHAIGKGLSKDDTNNRMLIIGANHDISQMVYDGYYYDKQESCAYAIDKNLSLKKIDNDSICHMLDKKLSLYKYITRYTYFNNALTKHTICQRTKSEIIVENDCEPIIVCENPAQKPSEVGFNEYYLLPEMIVPADRKYKRIRFNIDADIYINDSVDYDNYMNIVFVNSSKNLAIYSPDKIVRYIDADTIRQGEEYKLSLTKDFAADSLSDNNISIYVTTPNHDIFWTPNTKMTIKNAKIKIEGLK